MLTRPGKEHAREMIALTTSARRAHGELQHPAIQLAPPGQVWVCSACGKRSHDRGGARPIDYGWDESCYIWAVLCYETPGPDGKYIQVEKPT